MGTDSRHRPAEEPSPHRLLPGEVPRATDVLARSFEGDPFIDWVVRSDAKHDEAMRTMFDATLREMTMPYDEVWSTKDVRAVAIWTPPSAFQLGLSVQLRFLRRIAGVTQLRHLPSRLSAINAVDRNHPTEPHYYLFFMGVDPDRQGRGLGSLLLSDMLTRCDAEGMPSYLEATKEDLVGYYARYGYRALEPLPLPHGAPTLYPMWRTPSSQRPR